VTSGVRKFAMDAMPDNNANRGNFLRGGYGSSNNMRDPMLSRRPGSIATKSYRESVSVTCPRKILLSNTTSALSIAEVYGGCDPSLARRKSRTRHLNLVPWPSPVDISCHLLPSFLFCRFQLRFRENDYEKGSFALLCREIVGSLISEGINAAMRRLSRAEGERMSDEIACDLLDSSNTSTARTSRPGEEPETTNPLRGLIMIRAMLSKVQTPEVQC